MKGRLSNVLAVIEKIMETIREKCEGVTGTDAFDHKNTPRANEVGNCFAKKICGDIMNMILKRVQSIESVE